MARKTKEESALTRERILDAAELVFSRRGVGSATIAHIADTAGMSRGAVYGHYRNKVDICLAMCVRGYRRAAMPQECYLMADTAECLYQVGLFTLRQWLLPGSMQRSLDVLYHKCECRKEHRPLMDFRHTQERYFRRMSLRICRRGIEKGDLPADLDLDLVMAYIHVTLSGICHIYGRYREQENFWKYVELMVRIGVEGLQRSCHLRKNAKPHIWRPIQLEKCCESEDTEV